MNNTEILDMLMLREGDELPEEIQSAFDDSDKSVNALCFGQYACQWDTSEEFPIADIKRYIRFGEWKKEDFNLDNELVVRQILPDYFLDIFFKCKTFRDNRRNELSSTQVAFARMMGYKFDTQDEKAFVVYDYALQRFFNNSLLHKEEIV